MDRREFLGTVASLPVVGSSVSSATVLNDLEPKDDSQGPFTTLRVVNLGISAGASETNTDLFLRKLAFEVALRTGQLPSADEWATRSIILHRLGSKWWSHGLAVMANFQPMNQPLRNVPPEGSGTETTWWMFQLPHGIRGDASNQRAHVVLVPFFPQGRTQEREYRCWELVDRILRHIHRGTEFAGTTFWKAFSEADANDARRVLNHMSRTVA